MLRNLVITAAASAALCTGAASAQTINLAAVNTTTGGAPTATTLTLGTGSYIATVIGTAGGGLYDAWNYASSNGQLYPSGTPAPAPGFYTESYTITIGSGVVVPVNGGSFATAAAALAAYSSTPYAFNVTSPGTVVSFVIADTLYADNTGGVSLRIAAAAVPESATWAMMIVGFGLAGYAMRRRQRAAITVAYAA